MNLSKILLGMGRPLANRDMTPQANRVVDLVAGIGTALITGIATYSIYSEHQRAIPQKAPSQEAAPQSPPSQVTEKS